jgi:hypothetical protein
MKTGDDKVQEERYEARRLSLFVRALTRRRAASRRMATLMHNGSATVVKPTYDEKHRPKPKD